MKKAGVTGGRWLLFFYSVPAKPVKNRAAIWRKLTRAGALQMKGSVYVLPNSSGHEELFGWLVSEAASMGGEGAYLRTGAIEPYTDDDIIAMFNRDRAAGYRALEKPLTALERKLAALRKSGSGGAQSGLLAKLSYLRAEFDEYGKTDFFTSPHGDAIKKRIDALTAASSAQACDLRPCPVVRRSASDYQGRTWATRPRPFVDRIASAWLIRDFIDPSAKFAFIGEGAERGDAVTFDMRGGEFTHSGDLCTFEVLLRSFGLRERALKNIAETVHELDLKDGRYSAPDAATIEELLTGLRKSARSDKEMLEKGMAIFGMLYASRKP